MNIVFPGGISMIEDIIGITEIGNVIAFKKQNS
jgi:hypothetical protein